MAGVHGREQRRCLGTTHFTDNDAVRAHAEAGLQAVVHVHFWGSVGPLTTGFHAEPVVVVDLQFSGVFDRQEAAVPWDVHAKAVQGRRLT